MAKTSRLASACCASASVLERAATRSASEAFRPWMMLRLSSDESLSTTAIGTARTSCPR